MKLGNFLGMNNRLEQHALTVPDVGTYVIDASNVVFSNSGRISRAAGVMTISTDLAGAHSLWSDGTRTLYVQSAALYKITSFSPFASTKLADLAFNTTMRYAAFNGEVWYSNGSDKGRLSVTDTVSPWALSTPTAPSVAIIAGSLLAGTYMVTLTYTNAEGEESGASHPTTKTLTTTSGLRLTLPSGVLGATHINVYCSNANGDVMTLHATVATGTATVDITAHVSGATPSTLHLEPLPAGAPCIYNGRLLSFSGNALCFSEPYNFGLYNPSEGYIQMPETITNVVPAQNGVYVVSDITRFLAGPDVAAPETIVDVLPYGGVPGTEFSKDNLVGWMSHEGLILASPGGEAKNLQDKNLSLDYSASTAGAAVRYLQDGTETLWVNA